MKRILIPTLVTATVALYWSGGPILLHRWTGDWLDAVLGWVIVSMILFILTVIWLAVYNAND